MKSRHEHGIIEISGKIEIVGRDEAQCLRWEVVGADGRKLGWSQELMAFNLHCEVATGIVKDFNAGR